VAERSSLGFRSLRCRYSGCCGMGLSNIAIRSLPDLTYSNDLAGFFVIFAGSVMPSVRNSLDEMVTRVR
jgi:hypothetical protein